MGQPGRLLEVVGVEAAAVDDDDVLEAPGDVQVAVEQEARVAGAQVSVRPDAGVEGTPGGFGVAAVTGCDAGARDPDLADAAFGRHVPGVGVDDAQVEVDGPTGRDQRDPLGGRLGAAAFER